MKEKKFGFGDYWRGFLLPYLLGPVMVKDDRKESRDDIIEEVRALKGVERLWFDLSGAFCDGVSEIDMAVALEDFFDRRGVQNFKIPSEDLVSAPTIAAHYVAICRQVNVVPKFDPFRWSFAVRPGKATG